MTNTNDQKYNDDKAKSKNPLGDKAKTSNPQTDADKRQAEEDKKNY